MTGAAVVVCCYTERRWTEILAAVGSVRAQTIPVELVVVVDHADALLERLRAELPGERVLASTGAPGLSGARNTGVESTGAEVVLFLDDDAVAEPHWAEELLACFDDDTVAAAGGAVLPVWAGPDPAGPGWFPAEFGWVVGCSYTGQPAGRAAVRNPIGASMAVRRKAFEQVGGFSEALGRVGTLPAGCEETEFCIRVARFDPGARVLLEPRSRVHHLVPEERQRTGYVLRRCYHEGRSKAAVARLGRSVGATGDLAVEAAYVRRVLPRALARHTAGAVRGSRSDARAAAVLTLGLSCAVWGFARQTVASRLAGER